MLTTHETKLGPAVVKAASANGVTVELDGSEVFATSALAFPYKPQAGDVVLVIGSEQHYVIGLIQSRGDYAVSFPANAHFHARGGIQFSSGERVELHAPDVKVTASHWEVVARTLKESVHNAMRRVKELSSLRAGRRKSVVEGEDVQRAERHVIKAKKDVKVDGERIHLG